MTIGASKSNNPIALARGRVYIVTRGLINLGIHPGPTAINRFLGRTMPTHNRAMNSINGPETTDRTRAFLDAGYTKGGPGGRWIAGPGRCEAWDDTRCPRETVETAVYLNPNINGGEIALCDQHLREETPTKFDHIAGATA